MNPRWPQILVRDGVCVGVLDGAGEWDADSDSEVDGDGDGVTEGDAAGDSDDDRLTVGVGDNDSVDVALRDSDCDAVNERDCVDVSLEDMDTDGMGVGEGGCSEVLGVAVGDSELDNEFDSDSDAVTLGDAVLDTDLESDGVFETLAVLDGVLVTEGETVGDGDGDAIVPPIATTVPASVAAYSIPTPMAGEYSAMVEVEMVTRHS